MTPTKYHRYLGNGEWALDLDRLFTDARTKPKPPSLKARLLAGTALSTSRERSK